MRKFDLSLKNVKTLNDLIEIVDSLGLVLTIEDPATDYRYKRYKEMGVILHEVEGTEVSCNCCTHKFKTVELYTEVDCPNCGNKSYAEPLD